MSFLRHRSFPLVSASFEKTTRRFTSPVIKVIAKTSAVALLLSPQFASSGVGGLFADAESLLFKALREVRAAQLDSARQTVAQLIERYPNFRLAHLIHGDLLLAKARPLQSFGNASAPTPDALTGLRAEAQARLMRAQESIDLTRIPTNFLRIATSSRYAMALDVDRSRLYVFENRDGQLLRIADFYATVGKEGSGKSKEGDQRTPIGAYTLLEAIPKQKLTDFYGAGAFPLDYPNDWDRRHNRSGYGIWLHGVGSDTFARAPRASDGCIVVSNPDLKLISQFIVAGRTPIVVAQRIEWVERTATVQQSQRMLTAFERWRGDMQSLDMGRYLQNYGTNFAAEGLDLKSWEAQRRALFSNTKWAKVEVGNVSLVQYPGTQNVVLATFDQSYTSSKFNSQLKKRQLWQLADDGRWKIIFEGNT
jgi:murein L,D-transpeptidase YafK